MPKPLISLDDYARKNPRQGPCAICRSPLRKEIEEGFKRKYGASFVYHWLQAAYPDIALKLTRSMLEHHLRADHANRTN